MIDTYRIDRGSELRSPRRNDQGFLLVDGHATRVGVLEYADNSMPDGIRRELRLPEDLFDAASLASYEGVIVTDDHPAVMVDMHCAGEYQRGTVLGPGRRDGDHVAISLVINDAGLINNVEAGKVELSPGYRIKYDPTPGVHPIYGRHDGRQTDVRINHQAVVRTGRSGPTARLRMDGVDVDVPIELDNALSSGAGESHPQPVRADDALPLPLTGESVADTNTQNDLAAQLAAMTKLAAQEKSRADTAEAKLAVSNSRADTAEGGIKYEKDATVAAVKRADAADAKVTELTSRADAAEKKAADLQTKFDAAEKTITDERARFDARVKARVDIVTAAAPILASAVTDGKPVRVDDKTDRQIMESVITTRGGQVEAERSDDFVLGQFNAAVKSWQEGEGALAGLRGDTLTVPAGGGRSTRADGLSGRELMVARLKGKVKD